MTNASPPAPDPRVGTLLAEKYRIERLIGTGGMGSVYEAEHVALGKRIALKFLHITEPASDSLRGGPPSRDETSLARFQQEARAICSVESDHVVQVFDWGRDEQGHPFLVMELLDGQDLGERIQQQGRIPVAEALRFTVEALRGLRKVHAAGIIHRDLKPDNLFLVLGDDDLHHVKIVDFGLSKLLDGSEELGPQGFDHTSGLTQKGAVVGTPLYMSPEQIESVESLDHRTDIWSMGAILYEMLSGAPPFMDRSYARLVMAICQQDPADITSINPDVPPELADAVRRALTKDRDQRFQNVEAFIEALGAMLPSGPTVSLAPSRVLAGKVSVTSTLVSPIAHLPAAAAQAIAEAPTARANPGRPLSAGGPLDATLAAHTRGAATMWMSDAPMFSIWRGEVDSPDRLRVETRDGSIKDLRLEPVGDLNIGRVERVGAEVNQIVYPDVASRLAASLRHDGVRWWLRRRQECSVPVQVGSRALQRGEEAPLVHGCFITVGAMRATMVDRRYVSRTVPAETVDPSSGLLARGGLEQEVATALQQAQSKFGLVLLQLADPEVHRGEGPRSRGADFKGSVLVAVALHKAWPSAVVARDGETVGLIVRGEEADWVAAAERAARLASEAGSRVLGCGYWALEGESANAGSEVELALNSIAAAATPLGRPGDGAVEVRKLRSLQPDVRMSMAGEVLERARNPKHQMLLFAIEEQAALTRIGPGVVGALEQELAAILSTQVGPSAMVTKLAPGVIAAAVPRKISASELGVAVQCEWHARPPVTDGHVELPRTLSWEEVVGERGESRALELSSECADAHGVLSALAGGLPYPVAGRVFSAISASSAVERVKMLFDVLEGTWRFIAVVLAAAYFSKARAGEGDHSAIDQLYERHKSRDGLPLGAWREVARIASRGFPGGNDPIGRLVKHLLDVKLTPNQTFDTLSNLMHSERNSFAHGHYNEARAAADVVAFEQMTRVILRALRPLCAWTLVTIQRTEPDLYGESQTVEFIDHTGPHATGARRRIGFNSPMRLANVVYLARWREGLVLPLDPFIRRLASSDRFNLYWMDHLPRAGNCVMSEVVSGETLQSPCDPRRLPPLLRTLAGGG